MNSNDLTSEQLSAIGTFFDCMSHLLTQLKKTFTAFEKLIVYKEQYLQYDQLLQYLTEFLKQIRKYIQKMPTPKDQQQERTFKRTVMRILEVTQFYRYKYEELGVCIDLICLIKQSQSHLVAKQNEKDVKICFFNLLKLFDKHLNRFRPKNEDEEKKSIQVERKASEQINVQEKKPRGLKRQFSIQQNSSSIDNIIQGFNNYLKVVSSLDLDTTAFRSSFFQAKGKQNIVLQNDNLKRNNHILNCISLYSREFIQYLARRQLKKKMFSRRNKFFDKALQNHLRMTIKKESISVNQDQIEHQFVQGHTLNDKIRKNQIQDQQKLRMILDYRRKRAYNMKKIVISGEKLEVLNKKVQTRKGDNCKRIKTECVFQPQNKNIRVTTIFSLKNKNRSFQVIRKGLKDVKKALLNSFNNLNSSYYKTR